MGKWEGVGTAPPASCAQHSSPASLTCRDGAVSGVVVEPVEVFAALWAEVERTWNVEETQVVRALRMQERSS